MSNLLNNNSEENKNVNSKKDTVKKDIVKKDTVKKDTVIKKKEDKKDTVQKLNLSFLTDELAKRDLSKIQKDRVLLYKYPAEFTKDMINSKEGKTFRKNLRNKVQKFVNNLWILSTRFNKQSNVENENSLKAEIKIFDIFYKENYLLNDYTLKSISTSNDEKNTNEIKLMLVIINAVKAS